MLFQYSIISLVLSDEVLSFTYNVNVHVNFVSDNYDYVDSGSHDGVWAIVKVFSVTTRWRIHGTYQTRRWVVEE